MRPRIAMTQAEDGEWLAGMGRADDARPLLAEARPALEALAAAPWLERVAAAERMAGVEQVGAGAAPA